MIKFRKNKVQELFISPFDTNWYGKIIAFENIDHVIHDKDKNKFIIYTKQGKDLSVSTEHYERFTKEYSEWINNRLTIHT